MATAAKDTTKRARKTIAPATQPQSLAITGIAKDLAAKAQEKSRAEAEAALATKASESQQAGAPDPEEGDTVFVHAPTGFNLTLDDGSIKHYDAGGQRMPRKHAEHWYAKANGVTIK
jgi:hypothetical protein